MLGDQPVAGYATALDGTSLAYLTCGTGPLDVLWLPGVPYPVELLYEDPAFQRFAHRLGGFCRYVMFEGRGVGPSGGDPREQFEGATALTDLLTILDAAGCDRAALVGCGTVTGTAAIRFAVEHPDRLSALILIDAHAYYVREPGYPIGVAREELPQYLEGMRSRWGTEAQVDVVAPSKAADQAFRQRMVRCARMGLSPEATAASVRAAFETDTRSLLGRISVPTLVLHRQEDRLVEVAAGRYLGEHIPGARYVELPGADYLFFVGDADRLLDEVEEFLTGGRLSVVEEVVTRAILFTDIVSSTERSARLGHRKWTMLSDEHDAVVRTMLQRHRGVEVKTTGDGFLATFESTTRAVRCALDIAAAARAMDLEVRAGIHLGEIEVRSDDVVGLPVAIAKRILDLAGPSEVLVSRPVTELATAADVEYTDRGEHVLKGVPGRWRLFRAG